MNTVLYTTQLEPINIIWLPIHVQKAISKLGIGTITVRDITGKMVGKVIVKVIVRNDVHGNPVNFYYTEQEELALMLTPAFLPGQTAIMRDTLKAVRVLRSEINRLK